MSVPLFYFALGVLLGGFAMGLLGAVWVGTLVQRSQRQFVARLDAHEQRQSARDETFAREWRQWRAEQDKQQRHAEDLRALLRALETRPAGAMAHPAANKPAPLARTAERMNTPQHAPEAERDPERAERELSDEEIDALPPELPMQGKARKRILPAPRKPPMLGL